MEATYIALAAVVLSGIGLAAQLLGKSLSIREHEEFRGNVKESLKELKADYQRENDTLAERIKMIEQTRPTAETLQAKIEGKTK